MHWQNEKTLQDVALRNESRPNTGFLSWSNYIKKHKDNPAKRYEVAQAFLPWPLGFKESILALRAIIREKKKAEMGFEPELQALYKLAAWESFCPKHSDRLDEAGFKIFDVYPGGNVASLNIDYNELGYAELKLVNKTDSKLLVEMYGEPKNHSTLNELYPEKWQAAEDLYIAQNQEQLELDDSVAAETTTQPVSMLSTASQPPASKSKKSVPENVSEQSPVKQAVTQSMDNETQDAQQTKTEQVSGYLKQVVGDRLLSKVLLSIRTLAYKSRLLAILNTGRLIITKKARSQ